jgi:uncharacterized membrane protein YbaN (DUF454 family)
LEKTSKTSRLLRGVWTFAGTFFLAVGVIGIFLPVLPTTPFLLLSAACYFKGSRRMHDWLLNNKWFGSYLRNYREGKGVSVKVKAISILSLWATIGYSAFYVIDMLIVRIVLLVVAIAVTLHIASLPNLRRAVTSPALGATS